MNKLVITGIAFLGILTLSACTTTDRIEVSTVEEQLNISIVDRPRPLNLNDVNFRVVSAANLEEFVREYENGNDQAWFMISPRDYENLALNLAELRRYIRQSNEIIVYYESFAEN